MLTNEQMDIELENIRQQKLVQPTLYNPTPKHMLFKEFLLQILRGGGCLDIDINHVFNLADTCVEEFLKRKERI